MQQRLGYIIATEQLLWATSIHRRDKLGSGLEENGTAEMGR